MSIGKPQKTQYSDDNDLANDRKTIDQESDHAASDRRFDQVQQVHNSALNPVFTVRMIGRITHATLGDMATWRPRLLSMPHDFYYSYSGMLPSQIIRRKEKRQTPQSNLCTPKHFAELRLAKGM